MYNTIANTHMHIYDIYIYYNLNANRKQQKLDLPIPLHRIPMAGFSYALAISSFCKFNRASSG